jgi:predicted nucleotidyltransferase
MIPENNCGLNQKIQQELCQVFNKYKKINKVILYGSRAKGNFKSGSDIDLTIESPSMTISELLQIENAIDDLLLPYKIDLSLFHLIDNSDLIEHIHRVGILFYPEFIS